MNPDLIRWYVKKIIDVPPLPHGAYRTETILQIRETVNSEWVDVQTVNEEDA